MGVLFVIKYAVYLAIGAIQLMMFVRAILSWFPGADDSSISEFLYNVTEPVIMPARNLLERIPSLRNFPIDISFLVTFILLSIVQTILGIYL